MSHILIISSDSLIREPLAKTFERDGHSVSLVSQSHEAWGVLRDREAPPDLIFFSPELPMNATAQLIRHIHEDPRLDRVSLVQVLAHEQPDSLTPGTCCSLRFPFEPDDALALLKRCTPVP